MAKSTLHKSVTLELTTTMFDIIDNVWKDVYYPEVDSNRYGGILSADGWKIGILLFFIFLICFSV